MERLFLGKVVKTTFLDTIQVSDFESFQKKSVVIEINGFSYFNL